MNNPEMMQEYLASLKLLEKRHAELKAQATVYDKRIALIEEEMDELWEVIAALRKHEERDKYGWRGNCVSARDYR
jgi:prefoldin subunit 5